MTSFIISLCAVGYIAVVFGLGIVATVCAVTAFVLWREDGLTLDCVGMVGGFGLCSGLLYLNSELFVTMVEAIILR